MTERGFHPFAVLHFLRKTILLYLLPLLQVLFARNWAALRTALVQGAALLTVLAAVSAAVLHAGRWRVDAQGTLRVRWRLGVRLDRCLKANQLAALTIERPLLYRLAGASRVVLYPAGQKRTLTLLLSAQNAQFLADRMMPRRDAVAHTPRGGEKLAFAVLGANGLSTLALLALAIKQSRPYAPDAQTAAFAHLNRIAAWAARWLPMGTAWLLVLGGVLFCASLVRSAAHAAHYTVWRTESHLGSRGGFVRRYEMRLALEHPGNGTGVRHVSAGTIQNQTDIAKRTVTVIGQALDNQSGSRGAIAFIGDLFECHIAEFAGTFFDCSVDIFTGHVRGTGSGQRQTKPGIGIGIFAAGFHGNHDFLCKLGENTAFLCIGRAFFVLDISPFAMSGHNKYLLLLFLFSEMLTYNLA